MDDYGPIIDGFCAEAATIDNQKKLAKLFSNSIRKIGYDGFDAWCLFEGTMNNPRQPGNFLAHDYNLNILLDYVLGTFLASDPVMPEIGNRSSPFDYVEFLKDSQQNSSVKWQLRMLSLYNVHHGWLIPSNTIRANRGVTCYIIGEHDDVIEHFNGTRRQIQSICGDFIEHLARLNPPANAFEDKENNAPILSVRELDCIHWAARGKTNAEIAAVLEISENTVRYHMKNLFAKFEVKTRSNAVLLAIQAGLIEG